MLTVVREKVKVLLILYDGGKHAEDVSFLLLSCPVAVLRRPFILPPIRPAIAWRYPLLQTRRKAPKNAG
jgi:hypothetical protein